MFASAAIDCSVWLLLTSITLVALLIAFRKKVQQGLSFSGRVLLVAPLDSSLRTFWAQVFAAILLAFVGTIAVVRCYDGQVFSWNRVVQWQNLLLMAGAVIAAVVSSALITGCLAVIHSKWDAEHATLSSVIRLIATDLESTYLANRRDADQQLRDYVTVIDSLNSLCPLPATGPRAPQDILEFETQRSRDETESGNGFPRIHLCLTIDRSIPRLDNAISFQFQDRLKTWNNERYRTITDDLSNVDAWRTRDWLIFSHLKQGLIAACPNVSTIEWEEPAYIFENFGLQIENLVRRCCIRAAACSQANLLHTCRVLDVVPVDTTCHYRIPRAIRLLTSNISELLVTCRAWTEAERSNGPSYLRDFPGLAESGILNIWLRNCRPSNMNVLAWSEGSPIRGFSQVSAPSTQDAIDAFCEGWTANKEIHAHLDRDTLHRMSKVYTGVGPGPADALAVGNQLFVLGLTPQERASATSGFLELLPVIGMALNSKRAFMFDDLLAVITRDLRNNQQQLEHRLEAWQDCLYQYS